MIKTLKSLTKLRVVSNFSRVGLKHFSSAPEPLTVQQVENRVLDTLKAFSKVNQEKVKTLVVILD